MLALSVRAGVMDDGGRWTYSTIVVPWYPSETMTGIELPENAAPGRAVNFRAAAVLLICALKSKQDAGAAAIVDSKSILEFSAKRATLPPILEDMAQINGVSVRAAKQNTAAEVVNALSGARNSCFLPEAGAVVLGIGYIACCWLLLWFLDRQRIYLKV